MPRSVPAAAPATLVPPPSAHRIRTVAQNNEDARVLCERRKLVHAAARWAFDGGKGSKAAMKSGYFGVSPNVTRNMIEPLIRELKANNGKFMAGGERDHHAQILTNTERRKLAAWILQCADGQDPKDRTKVSTKIKEMLRARHLDNKRRKWGPGTLRLSEPEIAAVESKEPRLAKMFFERFYPWCRAHGIAIEEGVPRSQDQNRAVKMTEKTIQRHFHSEFGLEAELVDAGVMDTETKVIADPRRVLNSNETPQPIDAPQKGSRKKVAKREGMAVRFARSRACAGSPRARMPSGSGARYAVPKMGPARSGGAWLRAGHYCWATRQRKGCWRGSGRHWRAWMGRREAGAFLRAEGGRERCTFSFTWCIMGHITV